MHNNPITMQPTRKVLVLLAFTVLFFPSCGPSLPNVPEEQIAERISLYMKNPLNDHTIAIPSYTPISYSKFQRARPNGTTIPKGTIAKVVHRYKGLNNANRWVRRDAEFYFDESYTVIGDSIIKYLDPRDKDAWKAQYRARQDSLFQARKKREMEAEQTPEDSLQHMESSN